MKAAIYCRLSEEDRNKRSEFDDSESIQNQKAMLIQYALDKKWDVYSIYSDDDYAGADRNRPAFNKLISDAKEHKFDIVLCKTQSRFTRELELVEKYIHDLFPKWGVRFISIVDNADTALPGNKKSRQINGLINEWYLEDMSENIKSVLTSRRKNGLHIGSFALYGYKKDPEKKGHLVVDEEAARIVREVFTLFSQGYGKTAIARMLNDRGIPNPTEYKRLQNLRYKQPKSTSSTLWKYFAISNMLVNEIYIGNMVQGKYGSISYKTKENKPNPKDSWIIVKNTHEPIIDMELWNIVQKMVKQRAKPFTTGNIGIFAKKARCMECGYTMRSLKSRGRSYLQCATKFAAKGSCKGAFVSINALEKAVLAELNVMLSKYLDRDRLEKMISLRGDIEERIEGKKRDILAYEKKILILTNSIKNLYIDKANGIISEAEFVEFSRDFSNERERLKKAKKTARGQLEALISEGQANTNPRQIIEEYTSIKSLTREIVEKLIDFICVGRKDIESNQLPIEIHWNF